MPDLPAPPEAGRASTRSGHVLVAVDDGRRLALVARQTRQAGRGQFQALVLRSGELPLVLVENDVPVTGPRWEYRTSGLWVEAVCEQPGVHWSYGLEAFALAIEEPDELLERGYGHRTPLGWELDFLVDGHPDGVADGIEQGRLDGLVLTGPGVAGEVPFGGRAWRLDLTGVDDRWPASIPAIDGPPIEVALPVAEPRGTGTTWWLGHDGTNLTARLG